MKSNSDSFYALVVRRREEGCRQRWRLRMLKWAGNGESYSHWLTENYREWGYDAANFNFSSHTLSIPMLLKLLHYSLQSETDARFAEVQQQLVQKDGEIRELRVRIHCNKIKALIVAQTLKCCALVVCALALYPGPAKLSITFSVVSGRGPLVSFLMWVTSG